MKKIFASLIRIKYSENLDRLSIGALKEYIIEDKIYETEGNLKTLLVKVV